MRILDVPVNRREASQDSSAVGELSSKSMEQLGRLLPAAWPSVDDLYIFIVLSMIRE